ncbi:HvfC/BufC family peptide modification chaperone [Saccharopolyspora sp. 5N708]|uniref:HvfC/BufC family peptide modification chaperone n=1 Tax=Saccharopolyspora sp. 5N708 TaxID=3457424 RepID=UPI003FCF228E
MAEDVRDLAWIQCWMQRAMLAPEGLPPDVEQILTPSSRQSARERLAVYWRGYRLRLLETMRGLYPAVCQLLGRELFDEFALDYLNTSPPGSYSLFRLNDGFPEHLARTRPDADLPPEDRESWPNLVIDLAAFERAFNNVADGPGVEDDPVPDIGLATDRVVAAPCLRLVPARFPVHEYVTAVRGGAEPLLPQSRPTFLVVSRRDYQVFTRELSAVQFRALRALVCGESVRSALREVDSAVASEWLAEWTQARFFAAPHPPPTSESEPTQPEALAGRNSR